MARRVLINMTDDLDGTEGAETVQFAYDGRTYEIDLAEGNRRGLEEFLERYINAARRVRRPAATGGQPRGKPSDHVDRNAVRAWANEEGIEVGQRGRIPKKVIDAYRKAHAA